MGKGGVTVAEAVEYLLLIALVANAWQLNEIRKISRACYIELTMTRWENGRLVRAKNQGEGLSSVGRQAEDLPI